MNRLILIEGIPGSGKTTMAIKVKNYLEGRGYAAQLFLEGDLHPADLAWMSPYDLSWRLNSEICTNLYNFC